MSQEPSPGASPAAAPIFREIRSVANERSYAYRSLTPYTWTLLILVGLYILAVVATFVAGFISGVVSGAASPELIAITTVGITAAYILCAIAGGFWIYNAACNVRAFGGRGFEVTPGWAVGYYAIPVMAWFKPFQAMNEIDRASRAPEAWASQSTSPVLWMWWAAWIISGVGGWVLRFMQGANPGDTSDVVGFVSLGLTFVGLADAVLFFVIVLSIHRAQAETRARGANLAQVFA